MQLKIKKIMKLKNALMRCLVFTSAFAWMGCKPGDMRSSKTWSSSQSGDSPSQSNSSKEKLKLENQHTAVSLAQSGYLFSITNPKAPTERCWYLAETWGQKLIPDESLKSGKGLVPLTQKSVTEAFVKKAITQNQVEDTRWRSAYRIAIATCGLASPIMMKSAWGAVALAICGSGGAYSERDTGEKVAAADKAGQLATTQKDPQKDTQAASSSLNEKAVVDVFKGALNGAVGDGSLDCAEALATVQKQSSAKPK